LEEKSIAHCAVAALGSKIPDSRYPEQFEMDQKNLPCRHFEVFIMKYLVSA